MGVRLTKQLNILSLSLSLTLYLSPTLPPSLSPSLAFSTTTTHRPPHHLNQSWWVYESRAYTGSNMLSRITESALATMVLAVVNQHHARLHTPLQVLCVASCKGVVIFFVAHDYDDDNDDGVHCCVFVQ